MVGRPHLLDGREPLPPSIAHSHSDIGVHRLGADVDDGQKRIDCRTSHGHAGPQALASLSPRRLGRAMRQHQVGRRAAQGHDDSPEQLQEKAGRNGDREDAESNKQCTDCQQYGFLHASFRLV